MQHGCQTMWPMTSYVWLLFLMDRRSYVKSFASIFSAISEKKIFEDLKWKKYKQLPNHVTNDIIKKKIVDHFIPRWPSNFFILIGCRVLHMQLWHPKKASTYYCHKNTTLIPHEERVLAMCYLYTHGLGNICAKFPFDLSSRSREDFF